MEGVDWSFLPVHEYWVVGHLCPQTFSCSYPATTGGGGQERVRDKTGSGGKKQMRERRGICFSFGHTEFPSWSQTFGLCIFMCVCI